MGRNSAVANSVSPTGTPHQADRQETTPKKTAKRRQILEKHTPGWTQEEAEQQEEGPSQQQPEQATAKAKPAGKGKGKTAKKANPEPAEKKPVVHKPIKITLRRPEPEPEPEDFVQRVRLGAAPEEEAKTEESSEQLVRFPPRQGRERRARGPAPPVDGTQQRAQVLGNMSLRMEPDGRYREPAHRRTGPDRYRPIGRTEM